METMETARDCESTKGHPVLLSGGGFSKWPLTPEDEGSSKTFSLNQPFSASVVAMAALVHRQGKNVSLRWVEWSGGKTRPERDPWFKDDWMSGAREYGSCHSFFLFFFFKIEKRTNIKEIIPPLGSFTYSELPVFSQLWKNVEGHPEPIGWCGWSLSWLDRQAVFYSVSVPPCRFLFTMNRVTAVFPCHSHRYFPCSFHALM